MRSSPMFSDQDRTRYPDQYAVTRHVVLRYNLATSQVLQVHSSLLTGSRIVLLLTSYRIGVESSHGE